jgi:long-chain fatty acid transport protein
MKISRIVLGLSLAGLSLGAHATNGFFSHGYGMKAKGMAGASTAGTDDAFFGANNPAAAAFVGNRMDLGVDLFSPRREATVGGFASVESDENYFLIPEFGYNHMVRDDLALGVTVYGNGGMNTHYSEVMPGMNLCGQPGALGVDLVQLIVAPTAAYKVAPNHSIGVSPLLGYQLFKADGLPMAPTSEHDDAFGYGVRIGYLGKITPVVTIGAAYASKIDFQKFSKYNWLFLDNGDLDIPENYNLGVSWQATPKARLALDYQRINYSKVNAIGQPATVHGFGWDDTDVWKVGLEYKHNKAWTFRAGYSHTNNPIKGDPACSTVNCAEVTANILAPGVIKDHATLGFTYRRANGDEVTAAYMHAFKSDVSGFNPVSMGTDSIQMYQNSLGVQYSWQM